jgi:FMN reductase
MDVVTELGGETVLLAAADLELPIYAPELAERDPRAVRLVDALRRADGVVVSTPGYHGGMSGMIKNALDYVEDLRGDERPYLHGRPVGCIACAYGWQATATTLVGVRSVVHALRGWPTPLGVAVNSGEPIWREDGTLADDGIATQLRLLAGQVLEFVDNRRARAYSTDQTVV